MPTKEAPKLLPWLKSCLLCLNYNAHSQPEWAKPAFLQRQCVFITAILLDWPQPPRFNAAICIKKKKKKNNKIHKEVQTTVGGPPIPTFTVFLWTVTSYLLHERNKGIESIEGWILLSNKFNTAEQQNNLGKKEIFWYRKQIKENCTEVTLIPA